MISRGRSFYRYLYLYWKCVKPGANTTRASERSLDEHASGCSIGEEYKLEDLKVLRRSPDLLNNVTIGQGQLQLIMEQILFYHIWGLQTFWSSDLNNLMNNPSNSPVISEKQMFR